MAPERILIVGAGLAGSLLAVMLGRKGHRVTVCEKRPDPRRGPEGRTRSINLAISTRGVDALSRVGLDGAVLDRTVPMRGRMIHGASGELTFQAYGTEARHVLNSVSRAGLNRLLVEAAESLPNVEVRFGRKCVAADLDAPECVFENAETGGVERTAADLVIGTDGAYSALRAEMMRLDRFDYSQSYLEHGYKELVVPPAEGGGFRMERNALHIWPRGGFMMIALPNADGSFTCTCFWPFDGPNGFATLRDEGGVLDRFRRVFPDAVPLMPTLAADYLANPVGSLVTVRCRPWTHRGRVALLGDAAHAIVPFYGQGANAAFEDCATLVACLEERRGDTAAALRDYEESRRANADAVADLALANFVEMRDKTGSKLFLLGKKTEKALARAFPSRFVPLYSMVSFSRTPYADAVRRASRQWRIVRRVAAAVGLLTVAVVWTLLRSR